MTDVQQDKYIIRTSDRGIFKGCRQRWDFASKMRRNLEPWQKYKPFEFGTAFHAAMEVYYDPARWTFDREIVEAEALAKFAAVNKQQRIQVAQSQGGELSSDSLADYNERHELGLGMLRHYFKWARTRDNFTPIAVEIDFEVPILVPQGVEVLPDGYSTVYDTRDLLCLHDTQGFIDVVYQGRIDMLVKDEAGEYWIFDHKTAAQMGDLSWLVLNDQVTSYCWALQHMLKIPIAGFVYNEIAKKVPKPPQVLQSGALSVNKQQDTTFDLYMEALVQGNFSIEAYQGMLNYLKASPKQFVRRTQVRRSPYELEMQGRRIFLEAVDMLNDPSIYPSPSPMNCNSCMYRQPCTAVQDGSDVEFLLKNLFRKRED